MSPVDTVILDNMSLETVLVPCQLKFERSWWGYYSNITHTVLLFTGIVDVLFSKIWVHFDQLDSTSSLLTIPLKSSVILIGLTLFC